MTQTTDTILDKIIAHKRDELASSKAAIPIGELHDRIAHAPPVRSIIDALSGSTISLIAEIKKASPSKGPLRPDLDPVEFAKTYRESGASAISVLTDAKHFEGSLDDLRAVRSALPDGPPLLRKDFLFDEYQVIEARVHGADALLLIVAVLEQPLLEALPATTIGLGMTALVEVHDETEMERAAASGAQLIGITNRDLQTFEVDLATTEQLRPLAPPDSIIVAESGIHTRDDMKRLDAAGVDAVLIGESIVKAPNPAAKIRELLS